MSLPAAAPQLSLLIPTYNRVAKLARLLQIIEDELTRSSLAGNVDVLVSDNASTDSTPQTLASFKPASFRLFTFRQPQNLGMDANMRFLYEQASSEYVWFFGDDDILLPGSVARVLDALKTHSPDALTCSFPRRLQPRDVAPAASGQVEVIEEAAHAIELLAGHSWISIHILRRISLDAAEQRVLDEFVGTNWWFVPLAFSVLQRSARPRVCVLPEALAVWEDQREIRFPPETYSGFWKIYSHPFAIQHAPRLRDEKRSASYYFLIHVLFHFKAGSLGVEDGRIYEDAIKKLQLRPAWLLLKPKALLSFVLLKLAPGRIPAVAALRARWFSGRAPETKSWHSVRPPEQTRSDLGSGDARVSTEAKTLSAAASAPRLAFLIPTYNRAPKLARLLQNIEDELARSGLAGRIDVLVSDNASTDSTPQALASFKPSSFRLCTFRQAENLGMDRNTEFLYAQASADYVWFFSDDDILLPGSIARVLEALRAASPDALLYSFRHPPHSPAMVFNFPGPMKVIDDPARAIELLTIPGKLSMHVVRRSTVDVETMRELEPFVGTQAWYAALALSVLGRSARPRLAVIPDVLAVCDADFARIRFPPDTWSGLWKLCTHPFAARHAPRLLRKKQRMSYYFYVYFLYQVKAGLVSVEDAKDYDEAIARLEFKPAWLLAKPKCLVSFLLLKFTPGMIPAVAALRARWRSQPAS